ncbi:hypothetical protein [Nocardia sp. NPDC051981]|uniref:hypothetical protein n=1 Tax=Nocardia sp. NPDC051981 TaxID=3155417 RepID=UPI00344A1D19
MQDAVGADPVDAETIGAQGEPHDFRRHRSGAERGAFADEDVPIRAVWPGHASISRSEHAPRFCSVRADIDGAMARAYADISAEELAIAARVLARVTTQLNAVPETA